MVECLLRWRDHWQKDKEEDEDRHDEQAEKFFVKCEEGFEDDKEKEKEDLIP